MHHVVPVPLGALCAALMSAGLVAQCNLEWQSAGDFPGADGRVHAVCSWDPDGAGPLWPRALVGGEFGAVAGAMAAGIAAFDAFADRWEPVGGGVAGAVHAVQELPNGGLVVGGAFTTAGTTTAANVAWFDGVNWGSLGGGVQGTCFALALLPGGEVVAGGSFTVVTGSGVLTTNLARWDGIAWQGFGGTDGVVRALHVANNGDLLVAGDFGWVGAVAAVGVCRIQQPGSDAFAIAALGAGCNGKVHDVIEWPNGDVVVAGNFQVGVVASAQVARWNGASWTAMNGVGALQSGSCLAITAAGLHLGTQGVSGFNLPAAAVYTWTGSLWVAGLELNSGTVGSPWITTAVRGIVELANGCALVVGDFRATIGVPRATMHVVRIAATGQAVGYGAISGPVRSMTATGPSSVAATFPAAETWGAATFLDEWNGAAWLPRHSGAGAFRAIAAAAGGRLFTVGEFSQSGYTSTWGQPPQYWINYYSVALLGGGLPTGYWGLWPTYSNRGTALARLPGGGFAVASLIVGFGSLVTRFDPAGTPIPASATSPGGSIEALAALPSGELVAGGLFPNGNIARSSGTTWTPLAGGVNAVVRSVLVTSSGDVIVAGDFTAAAGVPAAHIARWDGSTWSALGGGLDGPVRTVLELPGGDLLVGGAFTMAGSVPADNLARWNGTVWAAVGAGTNGPVDCLVSTGDGTVWVGGEFSAAGSLGCGYVARLVPPCAAAVTNQGVACVGSGGLNVLTAQNLPWLGGVFRSQATGMPANGLVVEVNGLTATAVPMPALAPFGVAGCVLTSAPHVLGVHLANGGVVDFALPLPLATVLVGQALWQQAVPIEFDVAGQAVAMTASNALALVVGDL